MTDVEQPASVPSFGGFGKFVCSQPLLLVDTYVLRNSIRSTGVVACLKNTTVCCFKACSRKYHQRYQCSVVADAFADAETDDNNSKDYVHIRIQQRNGKKSLTTVQVTYYLMPFLSVASVGLLFQHSSPL